MSAIRTLSAAAIAMALLAAPHAGAGSDTLVVAADCGAPPGTGNEEKSEADLRRERRSGQGDHRADVCRDMRHDCAIAHTVGSPEYRQCLQRHGCQP